jgi:O-antigen/teichoic acid export membrane protein
VIARSIGISTWPACLLAVGGTLIAPLMIPAIYGELYVAAVRPFQIAIWMIPSAWFSGHFRFSLIAAGQQRWEFVVSAATAAVTVGAGLILAPRYGSSGAASALLIGGVVNLVLAVIASSRHVGAVAFWVLVRPVLLATAGCLVIGLGVGAVAGSFAAATVASLLFAAIALRQDNELAGLAKRLLKR